MQLQISDYNNAHQRIASNYNDIWNEINSSLTTIPLHLKASDQAGLQGSPIFDPVGTNRSIKQLLENRGWQSNVAIPTQFRFLGTDVDFAKEGVLLEVQFSNYPFLLNNVIRFELFQKSRVQFTGNPLELALIVTKAHMFPASNSTLYYEQAINQLDPLSSHGVFDIPIRLIGLFSPHNPRVPAVWTEYSASRYSRTVVNQTNIFCEINPGTGRSRSNIRII